MNNLCPPYQETCNLPPLVAHELHLRLNNPCISDLFCGFPLPTGEALDGMLNPHLVKFIRLGTSSFFYFGRGFVLLIG